MYIHAAITATKSRVKSLATLGHLTQILILPQFHVMTFHCYVPHVGSTAVHPTDDNDDDDDNDISNTTIFIILFSLSLVVNILLSIIIIYLIMRLKKITTTANSSQM